MANAVKWGIVSTADINRKVIPARTRRRRSSSSRSRAATRRAPTSTRRRGRSSARTAPTKRCSRTPRSRRSTSRSRTRCTASGRSRPSKRASTSSARSRSRATPDEVEAAFDAADRTGRLLSEAFMYRHNPQTKRAKELVDEGAIGELRLVRSTFSYSLYDEDNIRLRTDVEGGALMDVGCYNVSGSRLFGGEPGARLRRGVVRAVRHRLGLRRHAPLPGRRDRAVRLRHGDARAATSSRRSAARARSSSTIRGTATCR